MEELRELEELEVVELEIVLFLLVEQLDLEWLMLFNLLLYQRQQMQQTLVIYLQESKNEHLVAVT